MASLNKRKLKKRVPAENISKKKLKRGERVAEAKKAKIKPVSETKEFKAGKAQRATDDINCLSCMHWTKCPSKKKGRSHACTKLKLYPLKSTSAAQPLRKPGLSSDVTLIGIGGRATDNDEGLTKEERVISQLISRTLKGSGVIAADNRLDDRDIATAPNFFTWITDSRFMGTADLVPWSKQIEHPTKLLSEWCPNPKCTDIKWWAEVPVDSTVGEVADHVTFLEWGVCPRCHTRKSEWVNKDFLHPYNALAGLAGQRSAKTATAVFVIGYDLHRLLKSQNPSAMYGLPTMQVLTGTFAALTFEQAKDNIWSFIYNMITETPWFRSYHDALRAQCYRLGIEDVVQVTNTYARYRHRNLFYHVSGPNKRTMRGKCNVYGTICNTNAGFLQIGELVTKDGQVPVHGVTIDSHKGPRRVSHTYKVKVDETIRVTTKNGFTIEGTPEHPMLVITPDLRYVWRRLDNMQPGDHIVSKTAQNVPMFGTNPVSKNMATILGNLTANGRFSELSSNDDAVVSNFKKAVKAETGKYPTDKIYDGPRADKYYIRGSFYERTMVPLGATATKASEKTIPLSIRTAPKEIIHEFLEAYFECDSGINGRDGAKYGADIDLMSASKELIDQLQVLLLQIYGILGRQQLVVRDTDKGPTQYYILNLCGYDAKLFSTTFKRAKVNKYKDRLKDVPAGHRSDRRNVPYIREYLWNIWENARTVDVDGKRLRRLMTTDGKLVVNSSRPACFAGVKPSNDRSTLPCPEFLLYGDNADNWLPTLASIDPIAGSRVTRLLDMGAHYEEVRTVEVINKEQYVYDVTVPDGHAFTANGLASHNTRATAMIDEIGWFLQHLKGGKAGADPERLDAKGTHEALDRSLLTVRSAAHKLLISGANENVPMGYMYETSSPSSKTDMIMQLYEESRGSHTTYGYRMATWEANPTIPRDSPIIIDAYRKDPITAHRDYAAVPPVSGNPYVKLPSLKTLFSKRRENGGHLKTIRVVNAAGQSQTSGEIKRLKPHKGEVCVLAVDAGSVNNSFAITVLYAHRETGRIICPFIGEIFPSPEAPIHFPHVTENVLNMLIEHYNVQLVMSDRWQSIMMLQTLCEEHEIPFVTRSLKYPEFDTFRQTAIYDGALQLPMLECKPKDAIKMAGNPGYPQTYIKQPISHLLYQFVGVNDIPNVGVTKPDGGTDDLFRSLVLAFTGIIDPEYAELLTEFGTEVKPHIGVMVGGVGFGGGAQMVTNMGVAVGPRNATAGSGSMGAVAGTRR